ncbi:MAG TPA: hypothetical protein VJB87_03495 [Candidatus Nanoarchaeia archaeon]|nr:hypothetical protein [Candidatus Nanoarchaeia archaeon]
MGIKRAVFDSVFWIGFVLVIIAFFSESIAIGWIGVIAQVLGLGGMIFAGMKGKLPDQLPPLKMDGRTLAVQKEVVPAKVVPKPVAVKKPSWFAQLLQHRVQPTAKVVPKVITKEIKKEKPKVDVPKIPKKASVDRSRIIFFVVLVLALLIVMVIQALSFAGKPAWFYVVFGVNILILLVLFSSSKKIFRKRKSDIELQAEHLALQEQKRVADALGKDLPQDKKFELLRHHIRQALAAHFSKDKIVQAALLAGWPENQVIEAYNEEVAAPKGVESLIRNYELNILKSYVKKAIDDGFAEDAVVESALLAGWPETLVRECYDSITSKKIVLARSDDEEPIEEKEEQVLRVTAKLIKHETDLDRVYELIKTKKSVKMSDVASQFSISKKQAEEWAAILEKNGLIEMYYPILGEPELRWKSLKAIE